MRAALALVLARGVGLCMWKWGVGTPKEDEAEKNKVFELVNEKFVLDEPGEEECRTALEN
jgi:hypothetical protein